MKSIVLAIALLSCFVAGAAQWHTRLADAESAATKTGKPIMMLFTGSDWCQYCIAFEKKILNKREFADWADDRVVLLKLDNKRRASGQAAAQFKQLSKKYGVSGVPRIVITDPKGKALINSGADSSVTAKAWTQAADLALKQAGVELTEGGRLWTDTQGRTVKGTLYSQGAGQVKIKTDDGKIITIALDRLSQADQDFVNKQ